MTDPWHKGTPYESFMGRWSRAIAPRFLDWLDQPAGLRWLDVGCGTGALSGLIAATQDPRFVLGIDPSEAFVRHAAEAFAGQPGLLFRTGSAGEIPAADGSFDLAVAALALNFFSDPIAGLREMKRAIRPGGEIALYVWDYAEGMQMLRIFWDVVTALDPAAAPLDEAARFPICRPEALEAAFQAAGLHVQEIMAFEVPSIFESFSDYWTPFLGAVGPAPNYVADLDPAARAQLAAALQNSLPIQPDGTIPLVARAWGIRGKVV